jgi:hypothetical protein
MRVGVFIWQLPGLSAPSVSEAAGATPLNGVELPGLSAHHPQAHYPVGEAAGATPLCKSRRGTRRSGTDGRSAS